MTFGQIIGLIFMVIGFIEAAADEKWLLDPLGWFIAAIAITLVLGIGAVVIPTGRRRA